MTRSNYQIIDNGDAAISIIFNEKICEELTCKIIQLAEQLGNTFENIFDDIILGYQSLTLCYNQTTISEEDLKQTITSLLNQSLPPLVYTSKLIEIPVCYEHEFAPDLNTISKHSGLSTDKVIEYHCKEEYLVHMLGFLPGFLYLDGLNKRLACPRKT
ncbi:MAG: allophanate hydrolase subunit 1, partial [Gammaproteobacteria bacterium]|nr:allophanate hydrolase subunit 1 [Gammaproteobacteria bacterium]